MAMNRDERDLVRTDRAGERGGSKVTLAIVLLVLGLAAYAGFNYVPVAYGDNDIKTQMQSIATNAVILPAATTSNNQVGWATTELNRLATEYEIPKDAFKAEMAGPALRASIKYKREVPILPFGIYNYEYDFNYSVNSAGYTSPSPGSNK